MKKIYTGDTLAILKKFPNRCIQTCVTSPPYFGLRDYGTGTWRGGDPNCSHTMPRNINRNLSRIQLSDRGSVADTWTICGRCGAEREDLQIGLETKPLEYVQKLVAVFREVRRVLRDDGTLWLNLGDTYSTQRWSGSGKGQPMNKNRDGHRDINPARITGLPDKNLIGIPWHVAFALQADGWYLRQDVIWHKPNPMPESVTDRCTKAHEYLFLLSKRPSYYFDAEAIREPLASSSVKRIQYGWHCDRANNGRKGPAGVHVEKMGTRWAPKNGRNRRSVWTVTTRSYRGAHFATFPPELIKPCILAGAPKGGVVLDPFLGSGTTAVVARELGRDYVDIELNPAYVALARGRLNNSRRVVS